MKIKLVSELRKENEGLCQYIYYLLNNGKLTRYEKNGWLAYDEDEYEEHKANTKCGRPLKKPTKKIV